MEKLRMAKSAFEQASVKSADTGAKTAIGLAYLAEALIDMNAEIQEIKGLLNRARRDRNETARRSKSADE
jgi:hypothetical protein